MTGGTADRPGAAEPGAGPVTGVPRDTPPGTTAASPGETPAGPPGAGAVRAGVVLAFGTLSVIPVRVRRADRAAARWAMLLAPLPGLVLAGLAAGVFALAARAGTGVAVASVAAIGALAALTRGLHLDGLADVADGLGSGRPAEGALAIMKRSDIGPFGVLALLFVTVGQIACLARVCGAGDGWGQTSARAAAALGTAVVAGRAAIGMGCLRGVPPAREGGLGAMVARTVPRTGWAISALLCAAAASAAGHAAGFGAVRGALAMLAGLAAAGLMLRHAVRRFGGITGDVLGALAETAATAALVVVSTG